MGPFILALACFSSGCFKTATQRDREAIKDYVLAFGEAMGAVGKNVGGTNATTAAAEVLKRMEAASSNHLAHMIVEKRLQLEPVILYGGRPRHKVALMQYSPTRSVTNIISADGSLWLRR